MKISYSVYEDNGGGVHMIVNSNGERHVFTGLEYVPEPGIVIEMVEQLHENHDAWKMWDGWEGEEPEEDVIAYIEENDDEIAWGEDGSLKTVDYYRAGYAGRTALNLKEDPED